jgi:hypothetical protein
MTYPSVKTIKSIEWLDKVGDPTAIAKQVRGLMDGSIDPMTVEATEQWVNQCHNMPSKIELKMSAINAVLECHGTEALFNVNGDVWPDFEYCNTGDTYVSTVGYDYKKGKFVITSYGDWVERNDPSGTKY